MAPAPVPGLRLSIARNRRPFRGILPAGAAETEHSAAGMWKADSEDNDHSGEVEPEDEWVDTDGEGDNDDYDDDFIDDRFGTAAYDMGEC